MIGVRRMITRESKSNLIKSLGNKYYIDVIYDRPTYLFHTLQTNDSPVQQEDQQQYPPDQCIKLSIPIVNDIYRKVLKYKGYDIITSTIVYLISIT